MASAPGQSPCAKFCAGAQSEQGLSKDEQEVAQDQATHAMDKASEQAEEDAQFAIAEAGKNALRGVQGANTASVDGQVDALKAMSEGQEAAMAAELEGKLHAAQGESAAMTAAANLNAKKGIMDEGDRATSKYISDAKEDIKDMVKKIQVAGKEMVVELNKTIDVGKDAQKLTDKMVLKAEDDAHYAVHFMDEPHAEVDKAQKAAQKTEDDVRTGVIGQKFASQATDDSLKKARDAADQAMSAKIGSNFINKKVMKTKAGITDVTAEVSQALIKAENADVEAKAATFQAKKAKEMMGKHK